MKGAASTKVLPALDLICQRLQSQASKMPAGAHPFLTDSPTHGSQLRCSHPRHQRSPCHRHRASARGRTRGCQDRRRRRGHKSCLLCEERGDTDSGELRVEWAAVIIWAPGTWTLPDSLSLGHLPESNLGRSLPQWAASSEPSPQSSLPSHSHCLEMHRWFWHSNWASEQNLSAIVTERKRDGRQLPQKDIPP